MTREVHRQDEVGYLAAPFSYAALFAGVFLQPRRNDLAYKVLLWIQGFATLVLPDVVELIWIDPSLWLFCLFRVPPALILFVLALLNRKKVARLSDIRLSRFLTDSLAVPLLACLGISIFSHSTPFVAGLKIRRNENYAIELL